jgi:hypothetical protein
MTRFNPFHQMLFVLLVSFSAAVKLLPISGTFIDPLYDARLTSSNGPGLSFSCADWRAKVREMGLFGTSTVIFQTVHDARFGAFYPSRLKWMKAWGGKCGDVVGAVLDAVQEVFLSCEFVNTEDDPINNATIMQGRLEIMKVITFLFVLFSLE